MQAFHHVWQLLLCLLLISGPVPLSLAFVALQNQKGHSLKPSHAILAFLTYWCVLQVSVGVATGIVGQFFLYPVLIAQLVLLGIGLWVLKTVKPPETKAFLAITPRLSRAELFILAALSFTGFILLKRLTTLPIINYDSIWYHLPIMARWYQEGSFVRMPDFMSTGLWTTDQIVYYPFDWEILCTLFIMPFQEDFLVTLPNLLAWIMLGLAMYRLGDMAGAARGYNFASIALVLTIPLILQHINALHIDLPFAAFFLISLYFALSYHTTRSPFDIALFLMSFGMLLGIKMSAVGYGILPVLALVVLELRSLLIQKRLPKWFNASPKLSIAILLFGVSCCVLIGGFWYIRNWIEVGNPLGNVKVSLLGITFPGAVSITELKTTNLASLFEFTNPTHLKILLTQAIVRLQLPFLALLFQALLFPVLFWVKKRSIHVMPLAVIASLLLATTYLYWTTPMTGTNLLPPGPISPYIGQQIRFAMPALALLGVVAAAIATVMQTRFALVVPVVLGSSIIGVLFTSMFDVIRTETAFQGRGGWASKLLDAFRTDPASASNQVMNLLGNSVFHLAGYTLLFVLVITFLLWIVTHPSQPLHWMADLPAIVKRSPRFILPAVLISVFIASTATARYQRDLARHHIYRGVYDFIQTSVARDQPIGYLFSYRSYLLYGKSLDQPVVYSPCRSNSVTEWVNDLRRQQVSLVAIGPLEAQMGWHDKPEVQWLMNDTENFVRVHGENVEKEIVFYRLKDS